MKREIITTADGSNSIFVPELDENYHSRHGAIQESEHVFIKAGLKALLSEKLSEINILEVGFGTGLNAYLTLLAIQSQAGCDVFYTGLEAYPISLSMAQSLNYPSLLNAPANIFEALHSASWGSLVRITPHFNLLKYNDLLESVALPANKYNLIYDDAFAPNKQPELWTEEIFGKLYESLQTSGFLVTYCAKGSVKRAMRAAGFRVEARQGPIGKREMTIGFK